VLAASYMLRAWASWRSTRALSFCGSAAAGPAATITSAKLTSVALLIRPKCRLTTNKAQYRCLLVTQAPYAT
jgi:hypothetical protein